MATTGAARLVLLVTSPRLPAGLLTAEAWDLVRTYRVFAGAESEQTAALRAAGANLTILAPDPIGDVVQALLAATGEHGTVVWLAGPDGDEDLAGALRGRVELEVSHGSSDP